MFPTPALAQRILRYTSPTAQLFSRLRGNRAGKHTVKTIPVCCNHRPDPLLYPPRLPPTLKQILTHHNEPVLTTIPACKLEAVFAISPQVGHRPPTHPKPPRPLSNLTAVSTTKEHGSSKLKFLLLNARSCKNKTLEINEIIKETNSDIIFITETWLKETGDEPIIEELVPAGYKVKKRCRKIRKGGGVALIYREHFQLISVSKNTDIFTSFESCSAKFKFDSGALFCTCVYRPPNNNNKNKENKNETLSSTFFDEFSDFLDSHNNEQNLYVLGDFNFHYEESCDTNVKKLAMLLDEHHLFQLVEAPTHNKNHILDLVIMRSNIHHNPRRVNVSDHFVSDHKTISFEIDIKKQHPPRQVAKVRKLKNINIEAFKSDLSSAFRNSPPDQVDKFNNILRDSLDRHAPLCVHTIPPRPPAPWITPEVTASKRERRRAEHVWKKTGLTVHREIYKTKRQHCINLIRTLKKKHFNDSIAGSESSKDLFKVCNQLLGKKNEQILPTNIPPSKLPAHFNNFFIEKINSLRDKLDNCQAKPSFHVFSGNVMDRFEPVTEEFVRKIVLESPKKFCELDPLPPMLFMECIDILLPHITHFINVSLETGIVPNSMKAAIVRPLLKKTSLDQDDLKNYRPVSNLPSFKSSRKSCPFSAKGPSRL